MRFLSRYADRRREANPAHQLLLLRLGTRTKKKPFQKMFENNLEDFTFKIREEILCKDEKIPQALEMESETPAK